jgi:hypothetical protein
METVTARRARRLILTGVLAAAFGATAAGVASVATHPTARGTSGTASPVASASARQVVGDQSGETVKAGTDLLGG